MESKQLQIRFLFALVFVNLLGFGIMMPMLPYLAIHHHADAVSLGAMTAAFSFAQMIGHMYTDRALDRIGCKNVLLICTCGSGLSYFVFGVVHDLKLLVLFRGISGFFAGTVGAAQTFISLVVPKEEAGGYLSIIEPLISAGFVMGPAVGGALTFFVGFKGPCLTACAMCMVVVLAGIPFLDDPRLPDTFKFSPDHAQLLSERKPTQSLSCLLREKPQCLFLMVSTAAYYAAFAAFEATGALYLLSAFRISASEFGMIYTLLGIGTVVLQRFLMKKILKSLGEQQAGILGHALRIIGYSIIVLCPDWWAPYALGILLSGGSVLVPAVAKLLSDLSPPEMRSTVFRMNGNFQSLGRVIGPAVASTLYTFSPISPWYGALAFSVFGAAVLLLVWQPPKTNVASSPDLCAPLMRV